LGRRRDLHRAGVTDAYRAGDAHLVTDAHPVADTLDLRHVELGAPDAGAFPDRAVTSRG